MRDQRGLVRGAARAVARAGLVARLAAAVPEHVVDRRRGACRRGRRPAARPRAARRRGSRPPRASRARSAPPRSIRATRPASKLEDAVEPQHVRDEVVGEQRQAVRGRARARCPTSARSAAAICARLKNGTGDAVVGRDVAPGRPAGERSAQALGGAVARAGEREEASRRTRSPSSRRWRAKWPINSCPGSWPSDCGDLLARDCAQLGRRPRPVRAQPRLDRPEAGQPGRLAQRREPAGAEVDRVQLQRERGARLLVGALQVGRRRRDRRAACARSASIASSRMRTWRAALATRAAAARMSSVKLKDAGV